MSHGAERGDVVRTQSVANNVAVTDDVVLTTTPTTRTVFKPMLTENGPRGWIMRQKIGGDGQWLDTYDVDFRSAPANFAVKIELSSSDVAVLCDKIAQLRAVHNHGVRPGEYEFAVGPADEMIRVNDQNAASEIRRMVAQGHSAQMWRELADADPGLADRLAAGRLQESRRLAIAEFEQGLVRQSANESYWQSLFDDHPWMLQCASDSTIFVLSGDTYIGGKLPYGRSGKGGVATDFVTSDASTKTFGVVEIKTPHASLVGPRYRGEADGETDFDNVVHSMHPELTGAVVQIRNQISVAIESFRDTLARHPKGEDLNRLHPRGILITGTLDGLGSREQASFNQFRNGQHGLTILTFDELLRRLAITYEVELPQMPGSA